MRGVAALLLAAATMATGPAFGRRGAPREAAGSPGGRLAAPERETEAGTRFAGLADLARLPWFEATPTGVRARPGAYGPVIDCHTHLSLAIGPQRPADLHRRTRRTRHYLDAARPFDLAPYANLNFDPGQRHDLEWDLGLGGLAKGGKRATHTAPNLLAEMRALNVARSVLLPIDLPGVSDNAARFAEAAAGHPALVPFGSVHPRDPRQGDRLAAQIARGVRGVKVHPAVQLVAPEDPAAMRLYRRCGQAGVVVFWHCGPVGIESGLGRALTQVARYEAPIRANPRTTFVLGHAGALQADQALALAKRYPNVWLELASQGLPTIRRILAAGPVDRIVFGSDWPFYPQAIPLAKVLLATEGRPGLRRAVLHDNAARLLGLVASPAPASATPAPARATARPSAAAP